MPVSANYFIKDSKEDTVTVNWNINHTVFIRDL